VSDNTKQIQDWQEKVRSTFGDEAKLYDYLFETLENFFYRYLETNSHKNLKVSELAPKTFGALSFEANLMEVLRSPHPQAKAGLIDMAKSIPRSENPQVRYGLWAQVNELLADRGELKIIGEVHWDFPTFSDTRKSLRREVNFKYSELAEFRKNLALKIEEAAEVFG
jgi:hypothetical protein